MQWFAENPIGFQFMRWYRNLNFLYNMKKVTIVFDFESQSMDVSVNDARECVTPATTVEEMYAKEVFALTSSKRLIYSHLFYICLTAIFNSLGLHYLCRMNQK